MCFFVLLALLLPRLTLAILWFLGYTQGRFHPWWLGLLGFVFMPYLTSAYVFVHMYTGGNVEGPVPLILLGVAALVDLGAWGSGRRRSSKAA